MIYRAIGFAVLLVSSSCLYAYEESRYGVSVGGTYGKVKTLLNGGDQAAAATSDWTIEPYFNISAHIRYLERHEFGVVASYTKADGVGLWSFRPLDYRFKLWDELYVKGLFGVARYERETPAHGYYLGLGAEWRPGEGSLGFHTELVYGDKIARDRVLASDPPQQGSSPEIFYDLYMLNAYISYYF